MQVLLSVRIHDFGRTGSSKLHTPGLLMYVRYDTLIFSMQTQVARTSSKSGDWPSTHYSQWELLWNTKLPNAGFLTVSAFESSLFPRHCHHQNEEKFKEMREYNFASNVSNAWCLGSPSSAF